MLPKSGIPRGWILLEVSLNSPYEYQPSQPTASYAILDLPKMSQTPYKGDAETAENERECRFWLIGL